MHSIYDAYHAAVLLTSSLPDDGATSVIGLLRIEDLDLHSLAVKKASLSCSYLLIALVLKLLTKC
jgi:hypothetical protein